MSEQRPGRARLLRDAAKVGTYVYLECAACGDTLLNHEEDDRSRLAARAVVGNWGTDGMGQILCGICHEDYLERESKEGG